MLKFYVKQFSFKQFFKKWPPYGSSKFKNRGEHQFVTGSTQDSDTVSYMMESELKKEIRVLWPNSLAHNRRPPVNCVI